MALIQQRQHTSPALKDGVWKYFNLLLHQRREKVSTRTRLHYLQVVLLFAPRGEGLKAAGLC